MRRVRYVVETRALHQGPTPWYFCDDYATLAKAKAAAKAEVDAWDCVARVTRWVVDAVVFQAVSK